MLTIRVDKGKSQPHSRGGLKQIEGDWFNPLCSVNPSQSGLTRVECVGAVTN